MHSKILFPAFLILLGLSASDTLAQKSTYSAWNASTAPVIDGVADDACWTPGAWGDINNQWFTERPLPDSADFHGRYKAVWTSAYLYLLVEITDDILNENIADPLSDYWEDDCIEIFIDEDMSGGDHRCCAQAYNAFAYHISPITYDAVDLSDDGDFVPKLYNDQVDIAVKSKGSLRTMEISIKIFDDSYLDDTNNSPVVLTKDKLMGFSIAYCDDDGNGREDFIGTQQGGLDSWMNASLFGEMQLLSSSTSAELEHAINIQIFPNPARESLTIHSGSAGVAQFNLFNMHGKLLNSFDANKNSLYNTIGLEDYPSGMYSIRFEMTNGQQFNKIFLISH